MVMTQLASSVTLRHERRGQDAYFSIDIETDGPIPGDYSMLAIGIVEAGHHDGKRFVGSDLPNEQYLELKPIGSKFDRDALTVNGLDRDRLSVEGRDPAEAMVELDEWVSERASGRRPVMVASPAGFDWMFVHWYFEHFTGRSPFGHSSLFDIKTAIAVRFDRPVALSGRQNVPRWLKSALPHSHNALDDAREQAQLFHNIMSWRGLTTRADF